MRHLRAGPRYDTERFFPGHPAVTYLYRKIIEQSCKPEFKPFEIMMNGNKIAIYVCVIIIPEPRPFASVAESILFGYPVSFRRIPREIKSQEYRFYLFAGEFFLIRQMTASSFRMPPGFWIAIKEEQICMGFHGIK